MSPLLSIVIANYNYGHFLETAIRSVVDQEGFAQCELIVVDGGSTDNSVEIIKKYADKISWWCSEKDKGQSDAFNKGFAHARGKYGCWLNADDMLMPNALCAIIRYVVNYPRAEWVGGSSVFVDSGLNVMWCSRCVHAIGFHERYIPSYSVNGPSSFFLIENLWRVGGFDLELRYTMDIDLWRKFISIGVRLLHVKEYIWCFRIHEESKTSHRFTTGKSNSEFAKECYNCNMRYGITPFRNRLGSFCNRLLRLLSGAYLFSYYDTIRYRGHPISRITDTKE